ncbi:hypothetical protein HYH02_006577 [Chlamydomonas schloesseri]|uniref:Ribosomal eL28/Mak16 domain-containing protein n=1 Tax=Chlamydomonas schloesseri TaxID=2026947 RepID=A0A835W6K1_9CHLO|nr:hypothetical protein HYH02_006577 [Chlamydomonas schloesseri]|eukprot:KAG2439049.1 hypothetical protein HYH02_006577 [Chlamydomonas schloesseri]
MSSQLVWECIKGHNSKLRKAAKGIVFSAEAGNLYNKHSYKYSGLVNAKTVDISADGEAVKVTVGRVKNASKPRVAKFSMTMKKHSRGVCAAVGKQVQSYRPDLKAAAQARAAAVHKSIRCARANKK